MVVVGTTQLAMRLYTTQQLPIRQEGTMAYIGKPLRTVIVDEPIEAPVWPQPRQVPVEQPVSPMRAPQEVSVR